MENLELADIQGLVARGYGKLRAARFLVLRLDDPALARAWLSGLERCVTRSDEDPTETAVHVAFTVSGLRAIGLAEETLSGFSNEFREGMTTPHRQRILGDDGGNGLATWRWGGPDTSRVDAVLMLYAVNEDALATLLRAHSEALSKAKIQVVAPLETNDIGNGEHFGFRDGISQPTIEGMGRDGPVASVVRPGEFVLGYKNEYGLLTDRPLVPEANDPIGLLARDSGGSKAHDFGRNGTYLVIRQIQQDVPRFWQSLDELSRGPRNEPDPAGRIRLGAKMVGRWPGGAPLALSPETDDPALATANDFGYHREDADGLRCPIGAHVRRSNPRDSLDPKPGSEDSIELNRRHRILRRGRAYGPPISVEDALSGDGQQAERGLHFVCLAANIARQFEFVQHTWANNPKFAGLYDEVDPLIGPRGPQGATFAMPALPVRERVRGLPEFVATLGGGYFFLPGLRALRYLASLP
ncbi:MAG: Dyp-type peroxidase [Tepidiformaceae bacterium]